MRTGWVVLVLAASAVGCAPGSGGTRWAFRSPAVSRSPSAPVAGQLPPASAPAPVAIAAPPPTQARMGTAMGLFGPTPGALGLWPLPLPTSVAAPGAPALPALPFDPRAIPVPSGFTLPVVPGLLPTPPAAPVPPSSGAGAAAFEADLLVEVNRRRAAGGVCPNSSHVFPPTPPLAIHDGLAKAAHFHSEDMASRGYFEHKSPDGEGPGPRGRRFGYSGIFTGENIEMGSPTAAAAVANWMSSTDGHCMNILDERYHYFGGGYAAGAPYWTANFGP